LKKLLHIYLEGVEEVCLGHFGLRLVINRKSRPNGPWIPSHDLSEVKEIHDSS